jgi:cytochrome c-type biogenesis protein CcmH/NrfG
VHYHLGFAAAHTGDLGRAQEAWDTYLRLGDPEPRRRDVALRAQAAAEVLRLVMDEEGL